MRNNAEDECFSTDEELNSALSNEKGKCCSSLKSLSRRIIERILKRYITFMVLVTTNILLGVAIASLETIAIVYTASAVFCSVEGFIADRGFIAYLNKKLKINPEEQRLLGQFSRRNRRGVDEYAEEETTESLQRALETLREPRPDALAARSPYQVPYDLDEYDVYIYDDSFDGTNPTPSSFPKFIYGEGSAGPSSAPDPFPPLDYSDDACDPAASAVSAATSSSSFEHITDSVSPTRFVEKLCDSDEPALPQSQAHLSFQAVRTFGAPAQIYGANSYVAYLSSGEQCDSKESSMSVGLSEEPRTVKKAKTFEVSVEVHREASYPLNYNNDGSCSAEPGLIHDEITRIVDSDSSSDIPYMDDNQSSKSTCSTPLDEESTKTED